MDIKKIYRKAEALVSDVLIGSSDAEINKALPDAEAGMIIYTAGHAIEKQKALDGSWVTMASGGGGSAVAGKDGITPRLQKSDTAIQVSYDNGSSYEDLVQLADLKGEKGDAGKDGANGTNGAKGDKGDPGINGTNGTNGKDGKSVSSIELQVDGDGKVTGGTVTFDDKTSAQITITTV